MRTCQMFVKKRLSEKKGEPTERDYTSQECGARASHAVTTSEVTRDLCRGHLRALKRRAPETIVTVTSLQPSKYFKPGTPEHEEQKINHMLFFERMRELSRLTGVR